jgi:hypothetical protein
MGRAKQAMMDNEENNDLIDFLKVLVETDEIKGAANGIAKQVIDKGVDSMSPKQKTVIDNIVEEYKNKNVCERCTNGNVNALTDYLFIAENGLCPMCEYDREKIMRE